MQDVSEVAAAKRRLRAALLENRRARDAVELDRARAAVAKIVLTCAEAGGWTCVAAYEPMRTEPGSVALLSGLVELGVEVLVPVTLPDRDLDWTLWANRALWAHRRPGSGDALARPVPARLGVEAIARAQAVLVPALAVGRDGTRIGRGGGSYDRAMVRCLSDTQRVALVFDDEVLEGVPTESWDVAVNAAITPSGLLELGGPAAGNTAVTHGD